MTTHRKLAAILSADAAGYSRLMASDDATTLRSLNDARALFRERIEAHGGRLIDTAGDSVLAEFPSAIEAVDCAVEIQRELATRNSPLPEGRRLEFRIAINLGDVLEQEDGTIYGDGVNVAARLQQLAEPGAICISGTAFDQVEGKLPLAFKFIGGQQVKNIAKPVRVYRVLMGAPAKKSRLGRTPRKRALALGAAVVIALMAAVGSVWQMQKPRTESATSVTDQASAIPSGPAIAVLAFDNLSDDPKQDFLSDGLAEEIITALSKVRGLLVIARNSSFQYKGKPVDARKIAQELGVRYVLEGSVRRSAKTLRVTAQLLDATSGAHVWAETYDRALTGTDIFALQDDITSNAVANIAGPHGQISRARLEETKGKAPESIDSYDCVLRAAAYNRVLSPEGHGPVRDCLERAIARDPSYAEAWAWLALVYEYEYEYGFNARPELYNALDRALETGLRAADLDPNSAVVHTELIWIRFQRRELDAALASAERAVALNPNGLDTLCNAGLVTAYAGNWDRGIALTRKAMALSPNYPGWCHFPAASYYYHKGEYEQSLTETLRIEMPDFFWTQAFLAMAYGQLGRKEQARAAIAKLLKLYPGIAANYRREARKYNWTDDQIEHFVEGLRKAGLDIPSK